MTFLQFVFFVFAAVAVFSAVAVITLRNPVHAVLSLVLTFFSTAALWLLAEAEFLGITLVLVYVGAVMVLFLFVVMMLDINIARMREGFARYLPFGLVVALIMGAELVLYVLARAPEAAPPAPAPADYSNTKALGEALYTQYLYPFEIAAVILLVAIIAAIALTLRRRPDTKYLDPAEQIRVRRAERVRLVKMKSES
jgi:NADH-quinone oxidoreductase subunit J